LCATLAGLAWACSAPNIAGDPVDGEGDPPVDTDPKTDTGSPAPVVDAGPAEDADAALVDAADAGDANRTLRVFASSALLSGNMGGLAGADLKCQQLATAKGFPGTFKAWLSVSGTNAIDRITGPGPWYRVDGAIVVASRAALASGTLLTTLDKDENGATLPAAEDRVWTATVANGSYGSPDCNGWTSSGSGADGRVGEAEHVDQQWTSLTNEACSQVNRIYCFEL